MMTGPKELLGSKQMAETWDKAVIAEQRYKDALQAAYGVQSLEREGIDSLPHIGRLLRDAKLYEIGAGTSEIRRWLIGRELYEETA